MFTKQEFVAIFNANENKNFVINTNIAVGQGLNGVDYKTFFGYWKDDNEHFKCTFIKGVTENCVVLKTFDNLEDWWKNGKRLHFIPFANIVGINFIESECRAYKGTYPKTLDDESEDAWNILKDYQF